MTDDNDCPPVVVRPPILFGGAFLLAVILEALVPLGPGLGGGSIRTTALGIGFLLAGGALVFVAARTFQRAGTNLPTWKPVLALVEEGPYRYTRNPIYIGLLLFYFGLTTLLTSVWALLFMPIVLAVIHYGVVLREETFLTKKFGAAYTSFQARVPRWL